MLGIKLIKSDGTVTDLKRQKLRLKDLAKLVASGQDPKNTLIEYAPVTPYEDYDSWFEPGREAMIVNEEGLILSLPLNKVASDLATHGHPIYGNVVIIENEEGD